MKPTLAALAVALAACSGDDAAPAADAAPDAPATGIVGTWNLVPSPDSEVPFTSATFRADGSVSLDRATDSSTGTYLVAGGRITIDPDDAGEDTLVTDFVVTSDRLLLNAFLPDGAPTGFVGTWVNHTTTGTADATYTLALAADMTGSFTIGTSAVTGTWAAEATGLVFNGTTPLTLTQHFQPVDDLALGLLLFSRAP